MLVCPKAMLTHVKLASSLIALIILSAVDPSPANAARWFGYNDNFISQLNNDHAVSMSREAGANMNRIPVPWKVVERAPGDYNWAHTDLIYERMLNQGIRPLFVIQGAPCWAHPSQPCDQPFAYAPDRAYTGYFARFARQLARRYPGLLAIELGNEPNLERFFWPEPRVGLYAKMLREGARAIKAERRGMKVIAAGLAPGWKGRPRNRFGSYLRRLLRRNWGRRHVDAFAHHPFPRGNGRKAPVRSVGDQMRRFRRIMNQNGAFGRPIWVTETGISTAGRHAVTPAGQRRRLARIHMHLHRLPRVPAVVYHRLFDWEGRPTREPDGDPYTEPGFDRGPEWERGVGVYRSDGVTAKPAANALRVIRSRRR